MQGISTSHLYARRKPSTMLSARRLVETVQPNLKNQNDVQLQSFFFKPLAKVCEHAHATIFERGQGPSYEVRARLPGQDDGRGTGKVDNCFYVKYRL